MAGEPGTVWGLLVLLGGFVLAWGLVGWSRKHKEMRHEG